MGAHFEQMSAVLDGVKELRDIIKHAELYKQHNKSTILFVDEIHRFNKAQQDGFLPHIESGLLTLIGATTENPSLKLILHCFQGQGYMFSKSSAMKSLR